MAQPGPDTTQAPSKLKLDASPWCPIAARGVHLFGKLRPLPKDRTCMPVLNQHKRNTVRNAVTPFLPTLSDAGTRHYTLLLLSCFVDDFARTMIIGRVALVRLEPQVFKRLEVCMARIGTSSDTSLAVKMRLERYRQNFCGARRALQETLPPSSADVSHTKMLACCQKTLETEPCASP